MDTIKRHGKFRFFRNHPLISILAILSIVSAGYYFYSSATKGPEQIRYVVARAEYGTIVASVSGTGQVSAQNQVDIKAKVSGDVTAIGIKEGGDMTKDALLFQIDDRVARKAVRDATLNLETAKLSLEKLQKPPDALALLQAQNALAQAKRDLEDLQKPPDALALLQAENAVQQAQDSYADSKKNLEKAYEDGFTDVTSAILDLSTVMNGLSDILYTNTIERSQTNSDWYTNRVMTWEYDAALEKKNLTNTAYEKANKHFKAVEASYEQTSRASSSEARERLIDDTFDAVKMASDAVKAADTYLDFVQDVMEDKSIVVPSVMSSHQSSLDAYTSKMNTRYAALQTAVRLIDDRKGAIVNAERTLVEKNKSLEDLKNGPDTETLQTARERVTEKEKLLTELQAPPDANDVAQAREKVKEREEALAKLQEPPDEFDIRTQKIAIRERTNALEDAQEKLEDYRITASFDATLADVAVKKGDSVSAGTILATVITRARIAELSFNEIDVSRIAVGQKATLSFDALPDTQLTGSVAEIDTIGSSEQGVVSYTVTVAFDTDDERIKPGMSVSAAIIVDTRVDILLVPANAVKLQGESSAVDVVQDKGIQNALSPGGVLLSNPPTRTLVEVGISNDESTEILSGLDEGAFVVVRTIDQSSSNQTPAQSQNPSFRIPGFPGGGGSSGGGGGGFRMQVR
ncbi:HlyD family efflux transporter periplasmic adaptor subunit [Candidatus Uhrbacteria bacterium]|nr:HlyD family efflux transporter periplasmic adaptor subunit [Candidatus Uhrbacteria bacterium]